MPYKSKKKRNEYMNNRRQNNRDYVVERLGGKCIVCGSTENLEIDHIENLPNKRQMKRILTSSRATIDKELPYCQLLCADCHRKKSIREKGHKPFGENHGTRYCYKQGCRRPECRKANTDYARDLRRRKKQADE